MNFEQAVKTVSDMAKSDKKFKLLIQTFEVGVCVMDEWVASCVIELVPVYSYGTCSCFVSCM